jgi:hypothetical protein
MELFLDLLWEKMMRGYFISLESSFLEPEGEYVVSVHGFSVL